MITKRVTLTTFLKGTTNPADGMPGCANYDHYHGGCLFADDCRFAEGKRCGYFERAILPTARQIGQADRIYGKYESKVGLKATPLPRGEVRGCPDCGDTLKLGEKYCRQCTAGRRATATQQARTRRRARELPPKPENM